MDYVVRYSAKVHKPAKWNMFSCVTQHIVRGELADAVRENAAFSSLCLAPTWPEGEIIISFLTTYYNRIIYIYK